MDDLDNRARQSVEKLEQLAPQIDRLGGRLERVGRYFSEDLDLAMRRTSESINDGREQAENLQKLLSLLLTNVLESNSELAFAHEQSLQQASQRVNEDMGALMAVVSTAIVSSSSLQQQIVSSLSLLFNLPPTNLALSSNSRTSMLLCSLNAKKPSSKAWINWSRQLRHSPAKSKTIPVC